MSTMNIARADEERFLGKINKTNSCWLWTGSTDGRYGNFSYKGKRIKAHRFSWMLVGGEIPPGLFLCHHCDVTRCVNPLHLFLGTAADNTMDARRKGRIISPGEMGITPWQHSLMACRRGHPYNEINTRMNPNAKTSKRVCRICKREYDRKWDKEARNKRKVVNDSTSIQG